MYLYQRPRHPVQKVLGEPGRLVAAGGVDDPLGAVEVLLEAAAKELHVLVLGDAAGRGGRSGAGVVGGLVKGLDLDLVVLGALLVTLLDHAHAGGVAEVIFGNEIFFNWFFVVIVLRVPLW